MEQDMTIKTPETHPVDRVDVTSASMEVRVERGAKLLDGYDPKWAYEIDIKRLDMADCTNCIIGQRFATYVQGLKTLGIFGDFVSDEVYGFQVTDEDNDTWGDGSWRRLEQSWVARIDKRTAAKATTGDARP